MKLTNLLFLIPLLNLFSCASTTEGGAIGADRKQLMIVSSSELNQMAAASYEEVKADATKKGILDTNPAYLQRVTAVSKRLIPQVQYFRKDTGQWPWEVHVITSKEVNAYCMPGGKIAFYSGIIEQLQMTDEEIAAVMGHEMAHALREHGRERASQAQLENLVLAGASILKPEYANYAQLAQMGTAVFIDLPNSRDQESEADHIGIELMARAGYDPRAAVGLWQKMAKLGGSKPPQFLSTHPADSTRISQIQAWLPQVTPLYDATQKK